MQNQAATILGLLVAWFLGFEMGKWQMAKSIRKLISDMTKELEERAKNIKAAGGKEQ